VGDLDQRAGTFAVIRIVIVTVTVSSGLASLVWGLVGLR
jgi:hypothetical protein